MKVDRTYLVERERDPSRSRIYVSIDEVDGNERKLMFRALNEATGMSMQYRIKAGTGYSARWTCLLRVVEILRNGERADILTHRRDLVKEFQWLMRQGEGGLFDEPDYIPDDHPSDRVWALMRERKLDVRLIAISPGQNRARRMHHRFG